MRFSSSQSLHFVGKQVIDKEIRAFQTAAISMKKWGGGKQDGGGDSLPAVMSFELRPHDMEQPAGRFSMQRLGGEREFDKFEQEGK